MSAPWPASLPTCLTSWKETHDTQAVYIETDVLSGPRKRRRRYTGSLRVISVTMRIDRSQYSTLISFYENTLDYGRIKFTFTNPYTAALEEFEMNTPPSSSSSGTTKLHVSMEWVRYIP